MSRRIPYKNNVKPLYFLIAWFLVIKISKIIFLFVVFGDKFHFFFLFCEKLLFFYGILKLRMFYGIFLIFFDFVPFFLNCKVWWKNILLRRLFFRKLLHIIRFAYWSLFELFRGLFLYSQDCLFWLVGRFCLWLIGRHRLVRRTLRRSRGVFLWVVRRWIFSFLLLCLYHRRWLRRLRFLEIG